MLKIEFRAMGCQMAAFIDNGSSQSARALSLVPGWFEEWEAALSRFRPESELCALNSAAGRPFRAGAVLYEVVEIALAAARSSGGLVVPSLLEALELAGYERSFDELTASDRPPRARRMAPARNGWEGIQLDPAAREIWLPGGVRLDLGGVAKGWAAQEACRRLEVYGPSLVDAGGDIAISSARQGGERWAVAVADPLQAAPVLVTLGLERGGVATSGIDFRRWRKDGRWNHHIIDPRSLEPAQTDLLSVTVLAADVVQAEIAAKAVLILGGADGLSWLEDRPNTSALLAYQDGRVEYAGAVENYLWKEPQLQ